MTEPVGMGATASSRRRRAGLVLVLVLAVVAVAAVTSARRTDGAPFDPGSTSPTGTKGLVEVLGRFTDVVVTERPPTPDTGSAIVFRDLFDRGDARLLDGWIEDGGTLVVAGPSSLAAPRRGSVGAGTVLLDCAPGLTQALSGPLTIALDDPTSGLGPEPGAETCRNGGTVVVSSRPQGRGRVVTVAAPEVFTNDLLGRADNAVLAVNLLRAGDVDRVAVLVPEATAVVGTGDEGLVDLVPDGVVAAAVQLVVAFSLVVAWRARRLGRPVLEPQAVAVESSELTEAVGRLLAANRRPDRAAALLRDRTRTETSSALGLALDAPAATVIGVVADRTSLSADEATTAVAAPVRTDADLVAVASLLARIREELAHGIRPT